MSTGRPETTHLIDIEEHTIPLRVRHNRRARRLTLRIDPSAGGAVVTLPWGVPECEALDMVRRKGGWILARLEKVPPRVPFEDGVEIPYLGRLHVVRHALRARGGVWRDGQEIVVTGRAEHLPRRLRDWLRAEAKRVCEARAREKSLLLGRRHGRITVRDTRSRWGSCSANGNLSFCWRLILAPEHVLDYVVAHEIAHLKVSDHSPRFWRTVETLTPDAKTAKAWLKRHGSGLHRYGWADHRLPGAG